MFDIAELIKNTKKYVKTLSIKEHVELLNMLSNAYYNTGEPIVSDAIYDEIVSLLSKRDPDNIFLKQVGAPIKISKELVKLPFEMGSLTKIKPENKNKELEKWKNKYTGPYCISDKEDGVSAQIYKNQSGEIFMYTRGDGIEGQNISHLMKYIVDKKTIEKIPFGTSIRGELIISIDNFKKIKDKMKNARNAVSGLVNSKKYDKDIAKITDFIAYAILNPRYYHKEQFKRLKEYGFKTAVYKIFDEINDDILTDYLKERKKNSNYEMDGIVCFDDSKIHPHVGGYPDYAFAYKIISEEQIAETKVSKVIWTPSKDGYLKPKIEIEPVELTGTTVTFATAFNAKYIVDNNIGAGAKIKIIRSGDVIPYIYEVIKGAKNGPDLPQYPYKWNDTQVDLILKDENDANGQKIVTIKQMIHFFSHIGVKYLSEGIITKLVENDYDTIPKILQANKEDLYDIDGLGKKMVEKIYTEIDKAFASMSLEDFMGASNKLGRNLGSRQAKKIIETYPNIITFNIKTDEDEKDLYNKIISIQGFSDILTKQFVDNFKSFKKFYKEIAKIKDISRFENVEIKKIEGKFSGKTFVFTGFRDKDLQKYITDNGGDVKDTVSGNTYMLIHADDTDTNSNKFTKAKEKGVLIVKKSDFLEKFEK